MEAIALLSEIHVLVPGSLSGVTVTKSSVQALVLPFASHVTLIQ